jgi:hypothetical protein
MRKNDCSRCRCCPATKIVRYGSIVRYVCATCASVLVQSQLGATVTEMHDEPVR